MANRYPTLVSGNGKKAKSSGKSQAQTNALMNLWNKNLSTRTTSSGTLTFSGQLKYGGPTGYAVYGIASWQSILESCLYSALQEFLRRTSGQVTPEGHTVEPIGFSVSLKVNQQKISPMVITMQR